MASKLLQINILEVGILSGLCTSRQRLAASALGLTAASAAAVWGAVSYIEQSSVSVVFNMLVITACMAIILLGAYLQTVLVADLIFGGKWREQIVLGHEVEPGDKVERSRNMEFLCMCAALVFLNGFVQDRAHDRFFDRYHHELFFKVRLRSPDAEERLAALKFMSDPLQSADWSRPGLRALLLEKLAEERDERVAAHIAWNIGAMDLKEARGALLALLKDQARAEEVRAEAAIAIARLGADTPTALVLAALLDDPSVELQRAGMRALAISKAAPEATLPRLIEIAQGEDEEMMALAYWAIRESGHKGAREHVRAQLDEHIELNPRRCALLDALKMLAKPEDIDWVRIEYTREEHDARCEPLYWEERDERRHTLLYPDATRVKLIKAVANTGEVAKQADWFRRIATDPSEPWHAREIASGVMARAGVK